jgi:hypothetical protein
MVKYPKKESLDLFHRLTFKFSDFSEGVTYTVDDINTYRNPRLIPRNLATNIFGTNRFQLYHMTERPTITNQLITGVTKALTNLPITDIATFWTSDKQCYGMVERMFGIKLSNERLNHYYQLAIENGQMTSVEFCQYVATKGMGAHLLKPDPDGFCIDLLYMYKYPVRSSFLPYGAKLVLDRNYRVLYIKTAYTCDQENKEMPMIYYPDSIYWQFAYNVFQSSLITHVTIVNHALYCHFATAGNMLYVNNACDGLINPELHRFLQLFLFRTSEINSNALKLLVNDNGIVERIFAFKSDALAKFMTFHLEQFDYQKMFRKMMNPQKEIDTPLLRDAQRYFRIIKEFVTNYLAIIYPDKDIDESYFINMIKKTIPSMIMKKAKTRETLITVLSCHIFNVSFWHEHIGNMSSYVINPRLTKPKVYRQHPHQVYDSQQNTYQGVHLALYTSVTTMPRMTSELYKTQDAKFKPVFDRLVDQLNQTEFECQHMKPDLLECSLSL